MVPTLVPMHATPGDQPPPLTPERLLTEWNLDPWIVVALLMAAGLYATGAVQLRRRGVRWSAGRTTAFVGGGLGTVAVATLSALGTYDTVLFSVHAVQHMMLMTLSPIFLALGAPVTLALRTLPATPRRWLLVLLHSRLARVLSFAPLALALFVATPFALYYSDFYALTLRSAFWHGFLHLHFVVIGCMLMWPLVGPDPVPGRVSHPLRLLVMFVMLPFHAFLGISIMSAGLLAEDWYLSFERTWSPSPLDDQYLGGALMWASGDIVAVVMLAVLFVQWFRSSQREAAREDRRLDRLDAVRIGQSQPSAKAAAAAQPAEPDPAAEGEGQDTIARPSAQFRSA